MSEPNEHITEQLRDVPSTADITNALPPMVDDFDPARFVLPLHHGTLWSKVVIGALLLGIVFCCAGLVVAAVSNAHDADARSQSINNCKQMALAVNYCAGCNNLDGSIPPAFGPFDSLPTVGTGQTFFAHLLPYLQGGPIPPPGAPIKTYIAAADPYNPGTNSLISYTANATVLGWADNNHANVDVTIGDITYPAATQGGVAPIKPQLPRSFCGRTSGIIVVAERSAISGATWSFTTGTTLNNTTVTPRTKSVPWVEETSSYTTTGGGNTSPLFTGPSRWPAAGNSIWGMNGNCTAFTRAGCIVGMADGSARTVTQSNAAAGWSWAMNPNNNLAQPSGW